MKAHAIKPKSTMEEQAMSLSSIFLMLLNVLLGIFTPDIINLLVAVFGFLTVIAANLVKIIISVQELRQMARNKWKKPPQSPHDEE